MNNPLPVTQTMGWQTGGWSFEHAYEWAVTPYLGRTTRYTSLLFKQTKARGSGDGLMSDGSEIAMSCSNTKAPHREAITGLFECCVEAA
ncbi:hypothetical protein [Pseudomonas brassicacearum]|uniref:hypothetical protein n=1 Tax=Pseudomonas brassicacearum TaxID=930166 RepID=UPI001183068E|nr:hypothetical protein [Pseudomonas brassicacearum]